MTVRGMNTTNLRIFDHEYLRVLRRNCSSVCEGDVAGDIMSSTIEAKTGWRRSWGSLRRRCRRALGRITKPPRWAPSGIIAPDGPYWVSMRVQDTGCRAGARWGILISTCENFGNDFVDIEGVITVVIVFVISHCSEGGTEFWGGGHWRDVNLWERLAA